MTLFAETLIISLTMAALSCLPLFSRAVRGRSKLFFLMGTGALTGILFFDLLPDLVKMGGRSSLWVMGGVWVVYSILHMSHLGHHEHPEEAKVSRGHHEPSLFFLFSMIAHCIASGMLLAISDGLAGGLNRTVFIALLGHKTYEALTVSSILVERPGSRASKAAMIAAYSAALPVGVAATVIFHDLFTQTTALIAASLAVGTLLGCLVHDFLIPSISELRRRRLDFGWVVLGLALTQAVLRAV
jgi:zinc transporter ZupT